MLVHQKKKEGTCFINGRENQATDLVAKKEGHWRRSHALPIGIHFT